MSKIGNLVIAAQEQGIELDDPEIYSKVSLPLLESQKWLKKQLQYEADQRKRLQKFREGNDA